jgi:opacity protein-like surface antigen
MKKIIIALLVVFSFGAQAQDYFWSLTWDHSLPMGSTADKIGAYSVRGIGIDNRWVYNEKYSLGLYMGWHTMYEAKENETTIVNENTSVYGNSYRYINSIPLALNAHYYFNPHDKVSFFAGVGVGGTWLNYRNEVNLWAIVDKGWRFGWYPEVGVHVPLNRTTKLMAAAKYQNATARKGGDAYSYLNFNFGLSWGFF